MYCTNFILWRAINIVAAEAGGGSLTENYYLASSLFRTYTMYHDIWVSLVPVILTVKSRPCAHCARKHGVSILAMVHNKCWVGYKAPTITAAFSAHTRHASHNSSSSAKYAMHKPVGMHSSHRMQSNLNLFGLSSFLLLLLHTCLTWILLVY